MRIPYEVRIGLMAVIAIFAAVWGYKFLKGQNFLSNDNKYYAHYDYANQLNVSAPVFLKGLEIGTITDIKFDAASEKQIRVEFEIRNDIDVHPESSAYIISTGVLGGKAVSLSIPGPCPPDGCLPSNSELKGGNQSLITSLIGEDDLESSIKQLSHSFEVLLDSLGSSIGSRDSTSGLGRFNNNLQSTLDNVESMTRSMDEMFAPQAPLRKSLQNMESITNSLEQNNAKIDSIIGNIASLSAQLEKIELDLTVSKINSTLDKSEQGLTKFNDRLDQAKNSFNSIDKILGDIQSGKGTLGKVINEEDIYDQLNKATINLNLLLQDIRLNPDRYIKVSVFGKKSSDYNYPEDDPAFND